MTYKLLIFQIGKLRTICAGTYGVCNMVRLIASRCRKEPIGLHQSSEVFSFYFIREYKKGLNPKIRVILSYNPLSLESEPLIFAVRFPVSYWDCSLSSLQRLSSLVLSFMGFCQPTLIFIKWQSEEIHSLAVDHYCFDTGIWNLMKRSVDWFIWILNWVWWQPERFPVVWFKIDVS